MGLEVSIHGHLAPLFGAMDSDSQWEATVEKICSSYEGQEVERDGGGCTNISSQSGQQWLVFVFLMAAILSELRTSK